MYMSYTIINMSSAIIDMSYDFCYHMSYAMVWDAYTIIWDVYV